MDEWLDEEFPGRSAALFGLLFAGPFFAVAFLVLFPLFFAVYQVAKVFTKRPKAGD